MKFYFCETCGKRVTEKDVEAGQARNKKLKGVYCAQCSVGVMTMELLPVTEDEARKILGKSPTPAAGTPLSPGSSGGKPKRETTAVQIVTRKVGDSESLTPPPRALPSVPPRSKSQSALVGVVAGLAVAVVLGVLLLFTGGDKAKPAAAAKGEAPSERSGNPSPMLPGPASKTEPAKAAPTKTAAAEEPKQDPLPPAKSEDPATPVSPTETRPDDLAKTDPPVAPVPTDDLPERSLALLQLDDFQGGGVVKNFWNQGKDGRAIWGRLSTRPSMSATFKLDATPAGEGLVRVLSLRHERKEACKLGIELNGKSIFEGEDPATNWVWSKHDFKVPAGLLMAGENKLTFYNREDTNIENALPWYMLHEVQVLASASSAAKPAPSTVQGKSPLQSVALLKQEEFAGGYAHSNFRGLGKIGRTICGKQSGKTALSASFKLDAAPVGEGLLRILSLHHERKEPCKIGIELNGKSIFEGADPATTMLWEKCEFKIPAGLLAAGENKLVLYNREDGQESHPPWYMLNEAEVLAESAAAPAVPPEEAPVAPLAQAASPSILAEDQRTILRFYNDTFAKLKNQQPDAALAAARGTKIAEAKPLAALLERADALNKKALDALNKKPPATPITFKFKNEELTGQLKRVEGAFAWVVSKGLEVRVGVEELPAEIFLDALALDASKPEGQYDLVAFLFANGRAEAAVAQAKKMDPLQAGELMDMLEHYRILQHLGLFEDAVLAIEDALKEAKTQDAQRMLAALKRTFADLAAGEQKDRIASLEARVEGTKVANRIKELFSGEVLALRDDLYIELKYDFAKPGASREDFKGAQWTLTPGALSYTQRYGADAELHFKALFQPKTLHAEFVQNAVDHDYCIGYLGKVYTTVRWIGPGQVNAGFADKAPDVFSGKPWKHPGESGAYRYVFDRSDKEVSFKLEQTEFLREKLPAQAADEKTCEIKLLPSRTIAVKEIVIKGFLDKDWVQDALKNLPQPGATASTGYKPGLWAAFYSGDATERMKTYHLSRMEPKLYGDFGLGSPDKSIPVDNFAELLEGYIKIDVDGEYLFDLWADDYLSLKIGETLVAEAGTGQAKRSKPEKGKITLAKGYYPIKAKFVDFINIAKFVTKWKPPGAANFEEVPAAVFWHDAKQEEKK
ncbi:MAG: hypothetical protein HY291_09990 [Planctomycetes bacterium]|nr:hypothetical protein [Planctomycetota bacterium]